VTVAACGDDDAEADMDAVEQVAINYGASEGAEACQFMSASALDQLGGESGCTREFENVPAAEFEIREVSVDGNEATASVENVESKNVIELSFVKEDDAWRISEFPGIEAAGRPPGGLLPGPGAPNPLLEPPGGVEGETTETAPETDTGPETETETAP
jgi:hypothetical protein